VRQKKGEAGPFARRGFEKSRKEIGSGEWEGGGEFEKGGRGHEGKAWRGIPATSHKETQPKKGAGKKATCSLGDFASEGKNELTIQTKRKRNFISGK